MRPRILLRLLGLALVLEAGAAARAQVSLDPGALDGLQVAPPSAPSPEPGADAVPARPPRPASHAAPSARSGTKKTAKPGANPVSLPVAPPAVPALPPPTPVPVRTEKPPPMPVVSPAAPGRAAPIPGGVRLTFGPGLAILNPATLAGIHEFAAKMRRDPAAMVAIDAYAAGSAEDPSLARRLSLSRGLAVRAVLMADGIASPRIAVRAMGQPATAAPDTPADRADVLSPPPGR